MQRLSRRELWLLATLTVLILLVLPIGWVLNQFACCNWLSRESVIDLAVIWAVVLTAVGLLVAQMRSGYQPEERADADQPGAADPDQSTEVPAADANQPDQQASSDSAARITELRQSLLLAKSAQGLKRLLNQVEALAHDSPGNAELRDLRDGVRQALAAEQARREHLATGSPLRQLPSSVWMILIALTGSALGLAWLLGPWSPRPGLENAPDRDWIADWKASLDAGHPAPADIIGLRLEIGAEQSRLVVRRIGGITCATPVAVRMQDEAAKVETPGAIDCDRGRPLEPMLLSCSKADAGDAACFAAIGDSAPFRVAFVRVVPAVPKPPPVAPSLPSPPAPSIPARPLPGKPPSATPAHEPTDKPLPPAVSGAGAPRILPRVALRDGGEAPQMIALPAGCFQMGSPPDEPGRDSDERQHRVCVDAFQIGRFEVTFDEYDRFAQATKRRLPDDNGWGRGRRPVIDISWSDATAYAAWLSAQTGQPWRLPTEAEWEYAARAGTTTPFSTEDCIHTDQANYNGDLDYNGCGAKTGEYRRRTLPVGSLAANPWGIYDMHGNVWEWTCSVYVAAYGGAEQRCAGDDAAGVLRVLRGGYWLDHPRSLRSAVRDGREPGLRGLGAGLRLARDPELAKPGRVGPAGRCEARADGPRGERVGASEQRGLSAPARPGSAGV